MRICVYGAASPTIDKEYILKVESFGREMVKRGHSLVFGGGGNGLMGAAARGVKDENGYILGVIPKFFIEEDVEKICDFCSLKPCANGNRLWRITPMLLSLFPAESEPMRSFLKF